MLPVERDEWESVPNVSERKAELKEYARATIRKDKRIKEQKEWLIFLEQLNAYFI